MRIETIEIQDRHNVIEVQVRLHQNELTAIISSERRRFFPEWERVEKTHARAMAKAVDWLNCGEVNLRNTGGSYVGRN